MSVSNGDPWGTCRECHKATGDVRSAYCSSGCASKALAKMRPPRREFLTWTEDEVAFWMAHGPEVFRG